MRFITEFKVPETFHGDPEYFHKHTERFIYNNKERLAYEVGILLQESFGFQNPVNGDTLHHKLEIEAFPMDKWVEFKQKLHDYLHVTGWVSGAIIFKMIEELESYGTK